MNRRRKASREVLERLARADWQALVRRELGAEAWFEMGKEHCSVGCSSACRPFITLNNDNPRWQNISDWQPPQRSYLCACGCGEVVNWRGIGRKPRYAPGHRQRAYWRRRC